MFKDDVAPIDVPEVSKTFEKARVIRPFFSSTTCMPKNTNSGNPAGLRTRKAWQRRYRTADGCKEITSSHRLRLNHISPSDQSTPPTEPRCELMSAGRIRRPAVSQHRSTLPVCKLTIASNSRPQREHPVGGVIFRVPTGPCQRSQRIAGRALVAGSSPAIPTLQRPVREVRQPLDAHSSTPGSDPELPVAL